MPSRSRVHNSLMNVKVNLLFYLLSFLFAFISRKVFLDCLTADFVGLTGTLANIMSFLNLAEFGISTSIAFFLYKPLQEGDRKKICDIISVLGYLYQRIGLFIGGAGLLVSISFPYVFRSAQLPILFIYFTFYSYVASTLISYFINYRQQLLSADQKNYVASAYTQSVSYFKSGLQIFLAYYYKNLYLWVAVEFIFSWITCVVLNQRINKAYPWLKTDLKRGKILLKEYPQILKKTKQVFIHKLKNFALRGSDQIFIFAFVSLKMVAYYDNYMMLFNKINTLVNVLSDGMNAGVGNLVAENNMKNTMKVFWELTAIRFLFVGIIIFSFFYFTEPFISCWLGHKYLLSHCVLYLILISTFIMLSRGTVEMYISSYGLFADTWAAWTELGLNIGITLIGGYFWGIIGILLAKVISVFAIALFWKPYYLFRDGLKLSVNVYWKGMAKYYSIFALSLIVTYPVTFIIDMYVKGLFSLVICSLLCVFMYSLIYFLSLYIFTNGMKSFVCRMPKVKRILSYVGL